MQIDKSLHNRGDVACIADGDHDRQIGCIPAGLLGDFIGIGLLAEDTHRILGIQENYIIVLRQFFNDPHAVVKNTRHLDYRGTRAQWL